MKRNLLMNQKPITELCEIVSSVFVILIDEAYRVVYFVYTKPTAVVKLV